MDGMLSAFLDIAKKQNSRECYKVLEVLQTELLEDWENDGVACVARCMAAFLE